MPARKERLDWFNEQRFGMFIHWGLYAIPGRGEWYRYHDVVPAEEYHKLADQFNPRYFRPREWAKLAKDAGMRYMVMTAKHHDGFCLFDSKYTDFTSVKTAAHRDFIREYVEACREEGLGVGIYFSVKDWDFPAYFDGPEKNPEGFEEVVQHFHNQALELMSNYGKIDVLFYDCSDDANFYGNWGDKTASEVWRSKELNTRIRELQPDIVINDRSGEPEDYSTPENVILAALNDLDRMHESNVTMNNSWGYKKDDNNFKSTDVLLKQLISCASRRCNYLLNVGPDPEGRIPEESVERLREIGLWMKLYGDAVYGTDLSLPNWWNYSGHGTVVTKGNKVYLCLHTWPDEGVEVLTTIKNEIKYARIMATGQELRVRREGRRVFIEDLPIVKPGPWIDVIELEVEGKPEVPYYY